MPVDLLRKLALLLATEAVKLDVAVMLVVGARSKSISDVEPGLNTRVDGTVFEPKVKLTRPIE